VYGVIVIVPVIATVLLFVAIKLPMDIVPELFVKPIAVLLFVQPAQLCEPAAVNGPTVEPTDTVELL
jgi:hypothetical protein